MIHYKINSSFIGTPVPSITCCLFHCIFLRDPDKRKKKRKTQSHNCWLCETANCVIDCVSAITQPQLLTVWDSHNCWLCDWPCECNQTATILRECIYSSNTLQCTWIPQNRVSCGIFSGTNSSFKKWYITKYFLKH